MSARAGDLVGAVGGVVPGAAEQQPGDVRAGHEDVGRGGELGEQPVEEHRLAGPVPALHAEVAGVGDGVAEGDAVLGAPEDHRLRTRGDSERGEPEAVAQRVGVRAGEPYPAPGQRLDPEAVPAEGVREAGPFSLAW